MENLYEHYESYYGVHTGVNSTASKLRSLHNENVYVQI